MSEQYDVIVIGGGFYGCCVALFLRKQFSRVLILEKEGDLLLRASFANQARVHNGYHYPRSFITALRSSVNFPRFVAEFRDCVDDTFTKVYAIPRSNSKVSAFQFKKLCQSINAPVTPAPAHIRRLFNESLMEEIFCVREYAFDASRLREILRARIEESNITVKYNSCVKRIASGKEDKLALELDDGDHLIANQAYNCTYSQLNSTLYNSGLPLLPLKNEIAELALIEVPEQLKKVGVTVMDGPFFSIMPFPARGLHSLSHVRYTPRESWQDLDGYRESQADLRSLKIRSNAVFMLKDAQRYLPSLSEARHVDSLYEVKTVLMQNEVDDGRPILFRRDYGFKGLSLIMGGKIDNIYDILQAITESSLSRGV